MTNSTQTFIKALFDRNGATHVETVSLSRFQGDVADLDALLAHCQKVIEIVRPGAVVRKVGQPFQVEAR